MEGQLIINGVVLNHILSVECHKGYDHYILTIESEFSLKDMFPDISNVTFSIKNKSIVRCMIIKETYQKFVEGCEPYDEVYETQIIGY